jgi:NADPH2:quinone reductase
VWNVLPNRRGALFFDLWSGRRRADAFRGALREDLGELFGLLADGTITAPIDSIYPLTDAAAALRRAETGGIAGKIVILPGR